jgi:hypothetical protein
MQLRHAVVLIIDRSCTVLTGWRRGDAIPLATIDCRSVFDPLRCIGSINKQQLQ